MKIPECDLYVYHHPTNALRVAPSMWHRSIECLVDLPGVRILKMFDNAATPEKGREIVRVDVYHD